MSKSINELTSLSDEDLIAQHDAVAKGTVVGTGYFLDEIRRREQDKQTQIMLRYTEQITKLTVAITIMTGVTTIATLLALWAAFKTH